MAKNDKSENVYHNRADEARNRTFCCYFEGGINK